MIKYVKCEIVEVLIRIIGDFMHENLYRRDGKLVYIKQPEFNELEYTEFLWSDKDTMGDIGGTFSFTKEKWQIFYNKMIYPSDGKNFYCLVYNVNNEPVGEVSYHGYDSATKMARLNIKIQWKHRRKGYGREAIRLLLEYYFLEFGGKLMMETVCRKYPESIEKTLGFEIVRQIKGETTYRISKETFLSRAKNEKKKVCCVLYNGVDLKEITETFETFNIVNKVAKKDIFEMCTVGNGNIKLSNGVEIVPLISTLNEAKADILVIPGGVDFGDALEDMDIKSFIIRECGQSDFTIASAEGVLVLARCGVLKGHTVAAKESIAEDLLEISPSTKVSGKTFVDNGRIVTTQGGKSSFEGTLKIINTIVGDDLTSRLLEYIN